MGSHMDFWTFVFVVTQHLVTAGRGLARVGLNWKEQTRGGTVGAALGVVLALRLGATVVERQIHNPASLHAHDPGYYQGTTTASIRLSSLL
jgi:hypothetical protein